MHSTHFVIRDLQGVEWLQCQVDPVKSRRMDWSSDIVSCATGNIRIQGRCRASTIPDQVVLEVPVCSDVACFDPVLVPLPVLN